MHHTAVWPNDNGLSGSAPKCQTDQRLQISFLCLVKIIIEITISAGVLMSLRRALELRQGGQQWVRTQQCNMLQCNMLKELQLVKTQRYMLQVLQLLRKQCYMLHGTNNYKWDDTMTNHDSLPLGGGAGVGFTTIATTPVKKWRRKKSQKVWYSRILSLSSVNLNV